MSAKIKFPYNSTATGLYFQVLNSLSQYLDATSGLFVDFVLANVANYKIALAQLPNSNGLFVGTVPIISDSHLPVDVDIFIFNPATEANGPIGLGAMRIDKNNNEQPNNLLLYNIFAATVYNNLGVDTLEETYYGHDGWVAFVSEFNTINGNRLVTVGNLP